MRRRLGERSCALATYDSTMLCVPGIKRLDVCMDAGKLSSRCPDFIISSGVCDRLGRAHLCSHLVTYHVLSREETKHQPVRGNPNLPCCGPRVHHGCCGSRTAVRRTSRNLPWKLCLAFGLHH